MRTWKVANCDGVVELRQGRYWIDLYAKGNADAGGPPEWTFDVTACVEEAIGHEEQLLREENERLLAALEQAVAQKVLLANEADSRGWGDVEALKARVAELERSLENAKKWIKRLLGERDAEQRG